MKNYIILITLLLSSCSGLSTNRKPSSAENYQSSLERYEQALNEGSITEKEYDFLVRGASDLEKMRKISTGEIKVIKKPKVKESKASRVKRYERALADGRISQSDFEFLTRGL